jgi:hypothetical protein
VILLIEALHLIHTTLALYQLFDVTLLNETNLETLLPIFPESFQTLEPDAQYHVVRSQFSHHE